MNDKFILAADGKTPVATDWSTWATWYEANAEKKRVGLDEIESVTVSTVFLGLDHSFGVGDPVLWETMIFGGEHDGYQDRYTSYDAAVTGHAKALALVNSARNPPGLTGEEQMVDHVNDETPQAPAEPVRTDCPQPPTPAEPPTSGQGDGDAGDSKPAEPAKDGQ